MDSKYIFIYLFYLIESVRYKTVNVYKKEKPVLKYYRGQGESFFGADKFGSSIVLTVSIQNTNQSTNNKIVNKKMTFFVKNKSNGLIIQYLFFYVTFKEHSYGKRYITSMND